MDGRGGAGRPDGGGAWWLVLLLPLLCCGLPLLLTVVGTGAFAVLWARGYGYAALAALVLAAGALLSMRMKRAADRGGRGAPRAERSLSDSLRRAVD
jgi:hypothetical protein